MRRDFDCGWFYGSFSFDLNLNFLPCSQSFIRDVLAFFNGGIRWGSDGGYWFISDRGLLHFAFLINQCDCFQVEWRSMDYPFQSAMERARDDFGEF